MSEIDLIGTFTTSEMERATGLPDRSIELLKREGLMPGQVTTPVRGRPARYAFSGLKHLSDVSALSKATDSMVTAARIITAIMSMLPRNYNGFHSHQGDLEWKVLDDIMRGPDGEICPYRLIETAWRRGLFDECKARPNDFLLLIVDGEFVGWSTPTWIKQPNSALRYAFHGKSAGVKIEAFEGEREDAIFAERFANAEADLRLNLSLALRRAIIAIVKAREAIAQ